MMKKTTILNREQFREIFITPLENVFGHKVYWNSKKLIEIGLEPINSRGESFVTNPDAPIVLQYTKDNRDLLNTLIHEYGHSYLHNKDEFGYSLSSAMKEVEAESVAKKVFEIINLPYEDDYYIEKNLKKCSEEELNLWKNRKKQVDMLGTRIAKILLFKNDFIDKLRTTEESRMEEIYKYEIICPVCNDVWKHKRVTKAIKRNGQGFCCPHCGADKTLNKLIIKKLY